MWLIEITQQVKTLSCEMVRDNEDGSTRLVDAHFHTEVVRNLEETDKEEVFKPSVITILERL